MSTDFIPATESAIPFAAAPTDLVQQASSPPASSTDETESAYDRAWAAFQAAFDITIAGQAQRYQTLLELARTLPDIADQEVAQTRAEGERHLAAEREARRAILEEFDAHCEALRHGMATLAAELASAARRVDALARQVQAALAADRLPAEAGLTREPVAAESPHDLAGRASSSDEAGTDPWALVEAAMRLFKIRTPTDQSSGRGADPGAQSS